MYVYILLQPISKNSIEKNKFKLAYNTLLPAQHKGLKLKMEGDQDAKEKLLSIVKASSYEEEEKELSLGKRVWKESKLMWIVAGPAIFTRCSTFGIQIISQAFVGHIGSRELAAYSLVFTVLVRFVNGLMVCS